LTRLEVAKTVKLNSSASLSLNSCLKPSGNPFFHNFHLSSFFPCSILSFPQHSSSILLRHWCARQTKQTKKTHFAAPEVPNEPKKSNPHFHNQFFESPASCQIPHSEATISKRFCMACVSTLSVQSTHPHIKVQTRRDVRADSGEPFILKQMKQVTNHPGLSPFWHCPRRNQTILSPTKASTGQRHEYLDESSI
jgi:hypothetical protein